MTRRGIYHPEVEQDLRLPGRTEAQAVMEAIVEPIQNGEPGKTGKALSGQLAGCRLIRTGYTRIVYWVNAGRIEVRIVAAGMRRNDEVYEAVEKRT